MGEVITIGRRLETEIKPWPANLDRVNDLPDLLDEQ